VFGSSQIKLPRTSAVLLVGALAALAVGKAPAGAGAVTRGARSAPASLPGPAAHPGFPTFVHLPADQARHPSAGNEWWYTIGHVRAGRHEYGYEIQLVAAGVAQIGFTDVSSGKYISRQYLYPANQISVSTTALSVRMPNASLSGPLQNMRLTAALPNGIGTLDLRLRAIGPALYNNGTGLFPFLGGTSYYYSLPRLQTTGTLTLRGKPTHVNGTSWLDRQWGTWDWTKLHRWTWMALQLGNGQVLNLWDMFDAVGETHWATVLSPDGSERVVSVKPLAAHATHFRTSHVTGQRYAGRWTVEIPTLQAKLTVTAKPVLQEINAGAPFSPGINEAASTVAGTYLGRPVKGQAYVEQFGRWR
jgi:predicted secreted hydrolase